MRLHPGHRNAPQSAIIAVIMPDLERRRDAMWQALMKEGLYVNLARPARNPRQHDAAALLAMRRAFGGEQVQVIIGMFERAGRRAGII